MRKFIESYSVATGAFALTAAIILIATCQPAHAKSKISMQERIVAGQMAADELNDILTQNKIDLHRARCLRNGGTFDMNEVRYRDDTNTRRRVRDRGRGKIYQRGNTTVINLGALVFGRRPEVDIQSDYRADVDISNRACVYPKVR